MIKINNLNKKYNKFQLKDVSFSLNTGYIMGLIGANGAGKSTIIKSILTLTRPDSGSVELLGERVSHDNISLRKMIGFVMDDNIYSENFNIVKNARSISHFYPNWSWDDFDYYCRELKVDKKMILKKMSKGNVTKAQIVLALSHRPKVLIMDEPTNSLDPVARKKVISLIRDHVEKNSTTVLYSTHITSDLENFADYITYIKNGEVVFSEEYDSIKESYKLIKGRELSEVDSDTFLSYQKREFDYKALIKSENIGRLKDENFLIEQCSLEDIMYFLEEEVLDVR